MPGWLLSDWMLWTVTLMLGLIGLTLALRGFWGDWARGKPHCRKCWYELTGSESLTCPECGHAHKSRRKLFASRRHWKKAFFGSALFALALYCHTGPQVQYRRGVLGEKWWQSVVPTTAWIAMLGNMEEDWQYELLAKRFDLNVLAQRDLNSWLTATINVSGTTYTPSGTNVFGSVTTFANARLFSSDEDDVRHKPPKIDDLNFIARSLLLRSSQAVIARKNHPVTGARAQCVQWICALRDDEAAVLVLIEMAGGSDAELRDPAINALGDTKILTDKVVPALTALLRDPDMGVRAHAADALGGLGDQAAPAIANLERFIDSPYDGVATITNEDGQHVLPSSFHALKAAWGALRDIGPPAVPVIKNFLASTDILTREAAMRTLGEMGRKNRDAWPMLVEAATNSNLSIRYIANDAINAIGVDIAPTLLEVLRTGKLEQRLDALRLLGNFAANHQPTREAIFDLITGEHDETTVRSTAVAVLTFAKLDPRQFTKDFWRQLVKALAHTRPEARAMARQIILEASDLGLLWVQWAIDENIIPLEAGIIDLVISFGDKSAYLGPRLVPRMLAEPAKYKSALPDMLSYMGDPAPATLSLLVDALADTDADKVAMARESLDAIKPPAVLMLPVLYEKLKSPRADLRKAAIQSILQLHERDEPADAMREAATALEEFVKQEKDESVRAIAHDAVTVIRGSR